MPWCVNTSSQRAPACAGWSGNTCCSAVSATRARRRIQENILHPLLIPSRSVCDAQSGGGGAQWDPRPHLSERAAEVYVQICRYTMMCAEVKQHVVAGIPGPRARALQKRHVGGVCAQPWSHHFRRRPRRRTQIEPARAKQKEWDVTVPHSGGTIAGRWKRRRCQRTATYSSALCAMGAASAAILPMSCNRGLLDRVLGGNLMCYVGPGPRHKAAARSGWQC